MLDSIRKKYLAAYEKALDLKVDIVLKKVSKRKFRPSTDIRYIVTKECEKSFRYVEEYKDSFMVLAVMENNQDFDGFRTCAIYDLYKELCDSFKFNVLAKEDFARFVNKYFGYTVVDTRVWGVKSRVFIKKGR